MAEERVQRARAILADFVGAIEQFNERTWELHGGPISYASARHLADAFEQILNGEDPALALGLKGGSGRPKGATKYDEQALLGAYYYLCRRGYESERAKELLSTMLGDDRSVKSTIEKKSVEVFGLKAVDGQNWFSDDTLQSMMKPYADTVRTILERFSPQG